MQGCGSHQAWGQTTASAWMFGRPAQTSCQPRTGLTEPQSTDLGHRRQCPSWLALLRSSCRTAQVRFVSVFGGNLLTAEGAWTASVAWGFWHCLAPMCALAITPSPRTIFSLGHTGPSPMLDSTDGLLPAEDHWCVSGSRSACQEQVRIEC